MAAGEASHTFWWRRAAFELAKEFTEAAGSAVNMLPQLTHADAIAEAKRYAQRRSDAAQMLLELLEEDSRQVEAFVQDIEETGGLVPRRPDKYIR